MDKKNCYHCKEEKYQEEFEKYSHSPRRKKTCISCEKERELEKQFCQENNVKKCNKCHKHKSLKEFHTSFTRSSYKHPTCKECRSIEKKKQYHENPEKYRATSRKYSQNNPEKRRIGQTKYRNLHRFKIMRDNANKNSKTKGDGSLITAFDLWKIAKKQKLICPISGIKLNNDNISIDHKIAFANGGLNKVENIQLVEHYVNVMKLNHTEEEFLKLIEIIYHHQQSLKKPI